MTLLVATPAHAAAMALVHADAFPPPERWEPDEMALQLCLPGTYGLICSLPFSPESGEAGGGFILFRVVTDEAEVLTLAVTAAARGRGLGRRLLQGALDCAQGLGAASMFLEVSPGNTLALSLYASAGFVRVGCRRRYYPDGGGAVVLRRTLTPGAGAEGATRPAGA